MPDSAAPAGAVPVGGPALVGGPAPPGAPRRPDGAAGLGAFGAADQPAVTGAAGTVTHGELRARVAERARRYRPGERVPVTEPDPLTVLVTVLAAYRAGATAVVVDPAWPGPQLREALRLARAGEVVPYGHPPAMPAAGHAISERAPLYPVYRVQGSPAQGSPPAGEALFWIGFTSGSAGTPRPIGRTAASWATSFPLVSRWTGIGPGHAVLVPGSLASSLFLFGALHALWAGAHAIVPARWRPEALPRADAVHCVPTMLADLVCAADPPPLAVCGGAAIPERVRRAAYQRGITVLDYYGATELSFVAWRSPDGRLLPFPGVEIAVRDGEIWARGPYLSRGYAAPVTGPLRFDGDGFATVGDLGRLDADGGLAVLGRGDGTMLVGGSPVLPEDVESVVRAVDGVRDVVVLGTAHPRLGSVVTAVVEPVGDTGANLAALRHAVHAKLAAPQRPRLWYAVTRLPRTGSGKPARQAVAAGLADGSLPARRLR